MNGLEQVKSAVVETLRRGGLNAEAEFAREQLGRYDGAVISVGVRRGECRQAGFCDYLGITADQETGVSREIYGRRLDISLSLDAWAGKDSGAAACQEALERAHGILLEGLPAGIRPGEMTWEEAGWDRDAGMFLRKGTLQCAAYLLAEMREDTGLLSDFILKGVLKD